MSENTSPETATVETPEVETDPVETVETPEETPEETTPEETPEVETTPETIAEHIAREVSADPTIASVEEETLLTAMETVSKDALEAFARDREATEVYGRIAAECVRVRLGIIRENGKPDLAGATQLYKWWYATAVTAQWDAVKASKEAKTRMRNAIAQQVRRTYLPAATEQYVRDHVKVSTFETDPETGETHTVETPITEVENVSDAVKASVLDFYTAANLDHPTLTPTASTGGGGGASKPNSAQMLSNALIAVGAALDGIPGRYVAIALDRFTSEYATYLLGDGKASDPETSAASWHRISLRTDLIGKMIAGKASEEEEETLRKLTYDAERHGKL